MATVSRLIPVAGALLFSPHSSAYAPATRRTWPSIPAAAPKPDTR